MTIRKLEKKEWKGYFDRISKELNSQEAEIEVLSLALGDQVETKWLALLGITYDPKDDIVEVVLEGLDHMINKPREIYVDQEGPGISRLEVIDADGVRQIVKLRDELLLPVR